METSQTLRFVRLLLVMIMLCCTGCVSMLRIDGPYEGKVVDAETSQPLEGVVVHGTWYKVHPNLAGSNSEYYDSYEVLTDREGKFKIPGKGLQMLSSVDEMTVTIVNAGYENIPPNVWSGLNAYSLRDKITWESNRGTFKLKPLTMEQRQKRLISMPVSEPDKKEKLLRIEYNKEMIESGRASTPVYR